MKKNKIISMCFMFIGIGILIIIGIYINNVINIDSNFNLTTTKDTASFQSLQNQENTKNSSSFDFAGFNGRWSLIYFNATKNAKITKGKFYIVVLNSKHKILAVNKSNKEENLRFSTPENGKYIIRIVGKNASGNFRIKINSNTNIDVYYKDLMNSIE